jgi:hypothetical protein
VTPHVGSARLLGVLEEVDEDLLDLPRVIA